MVFSSPTFLFLFLPIVLALYFGLGKRLRNPILLIASLLFYAWGEQLLVGIMLLSIVANWLFGLWVAAAKQRGGGRAAVAAAICFDLGMLIVFKYTNWLWANLGAFLSALGIGELPPLSHLVGPVLQTLGLVDGPLPEDWSIRLPIGISFFTFQAMSYVIDVYRGEGRVQKNPFVFGVYIALFPQLIAGPIVRYRDIAAQLLSRHVDLQGFAWGARRFVIGLGKKMLVANLVAVGADRAFALSPAELTTSAAWLGILCYTVQIYFDFSGYSDMAIGLGRMLGFRFLENFDFPYVTRSISEFWRHWHISLSTWFRDYLYIPLGGNRHGAARTYFNLFTVFFLCGLWHGASWSFVVWGLFHGAFLVIERLGLATLLKRAPRVVQHAYLLIVVMVGWVFFRAADFHEALVYLRAMAGLGVEDRGGFYDASHLANAELILALGAGVIGSIPWVPSLLAWRARCRSAPMRGSLELAGLAALAVVFLLSSMKLAAGTYNPFIYFRF